MMMKFTTDGCSGFLSFAYELIFRRQIPCQDCCVDHDKAYWQGGTNAERLAADRKFYACLLETESRFVAYLMYLGVRIGGQWWIPFPSVRKDENGRWKYHRGGVRWCYGTPYTEVLRRKLYGE